jgi:endoglycosylceramidase
MRWILGICTVIGILFIVIQLAYAEKFYVINNQFVDEHGRERYFHGTNHWMSPDARELSVDVIKSLSYLGLNAVRIAINWKGIEPVRGQYNTSYIADIKRIVEDMRDHGMYAIIDYHQDCFSEKFCGGGAPDWAAIPRENASPFPEPVDTRFVLNENTGYPNKTDCQKHYWGFYCMSEAAASAYQNFYQNHDGVLDAFADMWVMIAKEFKQYPNVLGYELINEPFAGDVYYQPDLLLPYVAHNRNFLPAYDKITNRIKEVDNETLIFFEGVVWADFGTHFKRVPGGEQYQNKSVLSYHFYIPPNTHQDAYFSTRYEDQKRLKVAGFLTEFDVMDRSEENMNQITKTLEACDKYKQSWVAWTSHGWLLHNPSTIRITQTYAHAVAGSVKEMAFDFDTGVYTLTYQMNSAVSNHPTVIFMNEDYYYTFGYDVDIRPLMGAKVHQPEKNYLHIYNHPDITDGTEISVRISPSKPKRN